MNKKSRKSLSKNDGVLTYDSIRNLWLEANAKGFEPRTHTQHLFLRDTLLEMDDDTTDEAIWMCRDIMESNADSIYRTLYRGDDAERRFTQSSIRKFWGDVEYLLQDLISDKDRK